MTTVTRSLGSVLLGATFLAGPMLVPASALDSTSSESNSLVVLAASKVQLRDCPPANFCVFQHQGQAGRWGGTYVWVRDLAQVWGGRMNDQISSIRVNRSEHWCIYEHRNYRGVKALLKPNTSYDLTNNWFNDKISSFKEARPVKIRGVNAYRWVC